MSNLSEAQRKVLAAMRDGSRLYVGRREDLAWMKYRGYIALFDPAEYDYSEASLWEITPAGLAALEAAEKGE